MFIIYKITNLYNGKIYIGKTSRDLITRWNEHWSKSLNKEDNTHLHNAMRKYGKDNFTIEQIDICNSIEELNEKEQYYINFYNTYNSSMGYNLTRGGDGNLIYEWEEIRNLWDSGFSVKEITEILGCYRGTVGEALKNYEAYNYSESLSRSNFNKKAVKQFNKDYELLNIYPSITAAAKALKCSETSISRCLSSRSNSALGFYWCYEGEELPTNLSLRIKKKNRIINQYDKNGNYIKTFNSAADAARAVNPNSNINASASSILQVCKKNRKTAYGYIWEFGDE